MRRSREGNKYIVKERRGGIAQQEEVGKVTSTVRSEGKQEVGKDRIKYKEVI